MIDEGESNLTSFESPPGIKRRFCRTCGCSLFYFVDELPSILFYYPATLDDGAHPGHSEGAEHHVYVGSKAEWELLETSLPRHDAGIERDILLNTK